MASEKYFSYEEILKRQLPKAFSTMVKPVGSACNLDCSYCYYLDKESIYGGREPKMPTEILEEYIKQYIEGNKVDVVTFTWHGGEPSLAGLDFYRQAIEFQRKYAGKKRIDNSLQTNGILLDEEWCQFLHENHFLVGLSIDGPQSIHDANRLDKQQRPTFERVLRTISLLHRYAVEFNTMTTVNHNSIGRGREVYRFLKSIGSRYMQFMPVVEHTLKSPNSQRDYIVPPNTPGSQLAPWSVTAKGFGEFMCDIFDEWIIQDVGRYFVQLFDVSLAQWYGVKPALCAFCDNCGDSLVVEHNGDIYSCDHFVYPEYKLGNILDTTLLEAFVSRRQADFGAAKHNNLPEECRRCRYYFACRGECPKHRFECSSENEPYLNTLCEGYKEFFRHVDPYMRRMAELLKERQAPAAIMPWARKRMGVIY